MISSGIFAAPCIWVLPVLNGLENGHVSWEMGKEETQQEEEEEATEQASGNQREAREILTPTSLREDVRAMERAVQRIALFRNCDKDNHDGTNGQCAQSTCKKSGSLRVDANRVEHSIDRPHMYIKRMVNGKRVRVQYKEQTTEEFCMGFW